jgi:hypothetical protein
VWRKSAFNPFQDLKALRGSTRRKHMLPAISRVFKFVKVFFVSLVSRSSSGLRNEEVLCAFEKDNQRICRNVMTLEFGLCSPALRLQRVGSEKGKARADFFAKFPLFVATLVSRFCTSQHTSAFMKFLFPFRQLFAICRWLLDHQGS